jgi:NTP pyrophosphatase (non-canonical NTP hydrolase)
MSKTFNPRRTRINNADEYQELANGFINEPQYTEDMDYLLNTALGLTGEGGEFADMIKKVRFQGHPLDEALRIKLQKELGDVLWYIAQGCKALDIPLSAVMALNIRKLTDRHRGGKFSEAASLHKDETREAFTYPPNYRRAENGGIEPIFPEEAVDAGG